MYSKNGVIASPNWPSPFTRKDLPWPSRDCEWDIETRDTKQVIQLNVMDIDFDSSDSYCSSFENQLKLKGYHFFLISFILLSINQSMEQPSP